MPLNLSAKAEILIEKRNITPNLILEIDGVDTIYSSIKTFKLARFGEDGIYFGMPGLVFGGVIANDNAETLISLSGDTGNRISQQLLQDKGSVSSVSSFTIELIDKDQQITKLITPGVIVDELLSRRARVYITFAGGAHPDDSTLIHSGVIDEISSMPTSIKINVASAESLKRQELFLPGQTKLNGAISDSDTTITVDSTKNFLLPYGTEFETYFKIDNEYIKYTSKTATQFLGCTRGQLGSITSAHSDNANVDSVIRVREDAINFALKLMLSAGEEYYASHAITNIGAYNVLHLDPHVMYFTGFDVVDKYGIVQGSFVTIDGSTSNDAIDLEVTGYGTDDTGSWLEFADPFITELATTGIAKFKSQFNVWPEGCAMNPLDVDIFGHLDIRTRYFSSIPQYDFRFKAEDGSIKAKDWLSKEIYYPAALYSLPRKTRAGCSIVLPPVSTSTLRVLDKTNVINPSSLKPVRTTNQNFYNSIIFKYDKDLYTDKFLRGNIEYSADSQTRFNKSLGNKPLVVESNGLRDSGATDSIIRINSIRWLDRYKYAAEVLKGVKVFGKAGIKIEVGDVVLFGDPAFKLADIDSGSRDSNGPKIYEVINKQLDLKTLEVQLDLLATGYDLLGRYGLISPSTIVGAASTANEIVITPSYGNTTLKQERRKWQNLVGQEIEIHNDDYSYSEVTTLLALSPTDESVFIVSPSVSTPPVAGYSIDIARYPNTVNADDRAFLKKVYTFLDPYATIVSGTSNTVFEVSPSDAAILNIGLPIVIHNDDYSIKSNEALVLSIVGTTVTVDKDLGFTPAAGQIIELIGFKDGGQPYRIL